MKIRLIRDDLGAPSEFAGHPDSVLVGKSLRWKRGTIRDVDRKGCVWLVGNGDAEPADDEAEDACGDWMKNRAAVLLSRDMLAKGIDPEDREKYRRKEILGYDENGDYIPGPNWVEPIEEEEE